MDEKEIDWKQQAVDILLNVIDNGLMDEQAIGRFTYYYMYALWDTTSKLENGREIYCKIKSYLENINIRRLRKQDKIIVGFIANYSATWIGDDLYRLLEQSAKFEPYIFLIANHVRGQSNEQIIEEYEKNLKYFQSRNLRVVQTLNFDTGVQYTWEQIGVKPQLCIWLTPWIDLFREHFYLMNYSLDILHTYIPYGFMIDNNKNGNLFQEEFNMCIHNVSWKIFEETISSVKMAEKYAFVGDSNAVFTGYPKMDAFYKKDMPDNSIWDDLLQKSGNPDAKKIIYAPHHTLVNEVINFSTFASNYLYFLEIAEKLQDQTVWVFKPHPQLKYKAVREGVFKNVSEWDAYLEKWRKLKNACVVEEGMYHNLFLKSDAMILDSISFLAEYLYVHRPLLVLRKEGQYFNDFGNKLMEVHYSVQGTDKQSIEEFIENVVLNENDVMKNAREKFFIENLDYVDMLGQNAAANIFEHISRELDC